MMNSHIADDLPLLLTGEAPRDVVLAAAAHLRTCVDCQQELVSAVVAHASLASAQRFAIEAIPRADHPRPSLPDLGPLLAEVREDAARRPVRRRRALVAVAAAAAVVVGGGVAVATLSGDDSTPTRSISLARYDIGTAPATATLVGKTTLRVDATKLPAPQAGTRYEVWFTDAARRQLQAVGFIGDGNTASFTVPASAVSSYRFIEVSVQKLDEGPYSGTSVLRGSLS